MSKDSDKQTLGFQTEVQQLLQLMIHSLYSNKEIFLRELISNASDAADKLRFAALESKELLGNDPELAISIELDKEAGLLRVTDNGIGMSRDELINNIGTIARSGTSEFLQQMTGDQRHDSQLIGQFGVGFYSAFIVADRVVVETRKAGTDESVRWESDGQGEFTVESCERDQRGTTVELHLKAEEKEFLEAMRIENLIHKYSDHIAFPVRLVTGEESDKEDPVNSATALWTRPRSDVKDEEYKEFYKHLSHDFADPLTWSHNRVEGRREYTSLLFVPGRAPFDLWNREAPRGLKLYVQRVFIMDEAEQFLPLYLRFIKGVVDSSDLPLNVSRELLQQHPELDAMRSALTRRALDMLSKLAKQEDDSYGNFWKEFGQTLKEGVVEDFANREKLLALMRFSTTHEDSAGQDQSLADYVSRMPDGQEHIYFLLADNLETAKASPHLEQLKSRGLEVILLHDRVDPWMADHLGEFEGKQFQNVAQANLDLPDNAGELSREQNEKEHKPLLKKLRKVLKEKVETVNVSQRLVDSPACIVSGEQELTPQLRRMLEASGQTVPESKPVLEVNVAHPLLEQLASVEDDKQFENLGLLLLDHAILAEGAALENPADYLRRINEVMLQGLSTSA